MNWLTAWSNTTEGRATERQFYREHAEQTLLPFWHAASDQEYGGVFTCYSNSGDRLLSTDKFTWSQGRYLWLWARLARLCERGLLSGHAEDYKQQAHRTYTFLNRHALLEDGTSSFVLTREGKPKEVEPGAGYHLSFYADCFIVLGYAEYAKLTYDSDVFDKAYHLYRSIEERVRTRQAKSEPYPIPEGYDAHGFPMIMLNTSQELAEAAESLQHNEAQELRRKSAQYVEDILSRFRTERHLILEVLPVSAEADPHTLLARHINPGHSSECMWFIMHEACAQSRPDWIAAALDVLHATWRLGWDDTYGGLFRYVDSEGEAPKGRRDGSRFDKLVAETWDMKLWWPHSEVLYAMRLAYELTLDNAFAQMYEQAADYTFRTFPNPDEQIGEWIQIRSRDGQPAETVVALPVKDPYHILRNVLLILELLQDESPPSGPASDSLKRD